MLCSALVAGSHVMHPIRRRWTTDVALRCIEMKRFFLDRNILPTLRDSIRRTRSRCPARGVIELPRYIAIYSLLDSIRVFAQFAYRIVPHDKDIAVLWDARCTYLGVFCALEWPLSPTGHYMTNHFIQFVQKDGSAHHALQEGTEHHHTDDRHDLDTTVGRGVAWNTDGRTGFQQMLDQQEVRRLLVRMGYGPEDAYPLFVYDGAMLPEAFPFTPPRLMPDE